MNAAEVVESYVTDVAMRLPRKQRNDVAFELRALLDEELQAKADAAGRDADASMALELLRAFGQPADVAARYLPTLTIIDPVDGHRFLRAAALGLAFIWGLGLLTHLQHPIHSGWDVLSVLGHWWGGTVIPSLWWPGVLAVGFAASSWARRRWPNSQEWKPRAVDGIYGGRAAVSIGILGMVFGIYVLANPRWVLDFFWDGNAAPSAYQALTYSEPFLRQQGPLLFFLVLLNIPMNIFLLASNRRSPLFQRIEVALALLTCAAMSWAVAGGPILMSPLSDKTAKALLVLIVALVLITLGIRSYRSVRAAPNRQFQALR